MSLIYNPRQLVLISCQGKHTLFGKEIEKHDILPITWHAPASSHPPMYAIFVNKELMGAKIIEESRCFVVNFVSYNLFESVQEKLTVSGEYSDKLGELGLRETACEKLPDCFALRDAIGRLECEVIESKEVGDSLMFLGRVIHSEMGNNDARAFHMEGDRFTTTK